MNDKLPRESHVKQLLVDSMLCFSFDRPVTDICPILVLKTKMYKIEKILPAAPDFNPDESDLKAYKF